MPNSTFKTVVSRLGVLVKIKSINVGLPTFLKQVGSRTTLVKLKISRTSSSKLGCFRTSTLRSPIIYRDVPSCKHLSDTYSSAVIR